MFCTQCGAENLESSVNCSKCGKALIKTTPEPVNKPLHIHNYLAQAILTTICCCLPFGIVSIVYAAQVNSKIEAGDIDGAMDCSKKANMWSIIAFAIGISIGILQILHLTIKP